MFTLNKNSAEPIYSQIKQQLMQKIMRKEIKAGEKLPPGPEIAKRCHIAAMTLRQAFSELVNKKLLIPVPGKGTFVAPQDVLDQYFAAQNFLHLHTKIIEVVIFNPHTMDRAHNPLGWFISLGVYQGITDIGKDLGYTVSLLTLSLNDPADINYSKITGNNQEKSVGAIFLSFEGEYIRRTFKSLTQREFPFVVVCDYDLKKYSSVFVDLEEGSYRVVKYLINRGHRKIAHLAGSLNYPCFRLPFEGYQRALKEAGIPLKKEWVIECEGDIHGGYEAMSTLLSLKNSPTAVFSTNDFRAIGAMEAIKKKGLRIPEDIAVIGSDDVEEAKEQNPALSTMKYPRYELGKALMKLLHQIICREMTPPASVKIDTELIIRDSSG